MHRTTHQAVAPPGCREHSASVGMLTTQRQSKGLSRFIQRQSKRTRQRSSNQRLLSVAAFISLAFLGFACFALYTSRSLQDQGDKSDASAHTHARSLKSTASWATCTFELAHGKIGFVVLYAFVIFHLFVGIAILCDDYFVPSLEGISEALQLSEDVAGATFMAAGSSAPELFTSIAGISVDSDVGIGTIIGSAVFNAFVIVALSGAFAGKTLHLDWKPLTRDTVFYGLSIGAFIWFSWDGYLELWESGVLLGLYILYLVLMVFNKRLMRLMAKLDGRNRVTPANDDDKTDADSTLQQVAASQLKGSPIAGGDGVNCEKKVTTLSTEMLTKQARVDAEKSAQSDDQLDRALAVMKQVSLQGKLPALQHVSSHEQRLDEQERVHALQSKTSLARHASLNIQQLDSHQSVTPRPSQVHRHSSHKSSLRRTRVSATNDEIVDMVEGSNGGDSSRIFHHRLQGRLSHTMTRSRHASISVGRHSMSIDIPSFSVDDTAPTSSPPSKLCVEQDSSALAELSQHLMAPCRVSLAPSASTLSSWVHTPDTHSMAGDDRDDQDEINRSFPSRLSLSSGSEVSVDAQPTRERRSQSEQGQAQSEQDQALESGNSAIDVHKKEEHEAEEEGGDVEAQLSCKQRLCFPCNQGDYPHLDRDEEGQSSCTKRLKLVWEWLMYMIAAPYVWLFTNTIPSGVKHYIVSFFICMVWIMALSFAMVTLVERAGCILGIDNYVMGLVIVAAGTSIPDALSSILVARDGYGDMAVSNAIGSNVFDIDLGLGFPFLLKSIITKQPVDLLASSFRQDFESGIRGLTDHAKFGFILLGALVLAYAVLAAMRFRLTRGVGTLFFAMYLIFITYSLVQELHCNRHGKVC
eukprot:m.277954 g.277954  ORF g.277954 m.277954 type:complete len:864 (+) comp15734_c0_seq4:312-2903(+)